MFPQDADESFDEDAIAAGVRDEDVWTLRKGSTPPRPSDTSLDRLFQLLVKVVEHTLDSPDGLGRVASKADTLLSTKKPRYIPSWFQVDWEHAMSKIFGE